MGKCLSVSIEKVSEKIDQIEQDLNSKYKPVSQSSEAPLPAVPITIDEDNELDTIFADSEI